MGCNGALDLPLAAACSQGAAGFWLGALVCSPSPDSSFWGEQELTGNMSVSPRQPQRRRENLLEVHTIAHHSCWMIFREHPSQKESQVVCRVWGEKRDLRASGSQVCP